jgi:para-nitrobenzyl esterase
MFRLKGTLIAMIASVMLSVFTSTPVSAHAVLLLSSGSPDLDGRVRTVLETQGHVVTIGKNFTQFSGEGLAAQNVVLLMATLDSGDGDMPAAGQSALLNFVSNGGGLVTSEWTIWKSAGKSFSTLRSAFPVLSSASYSELPTITYKSATPDPVLNVGMPSSLTFNADFLYGTETFFAPRPGATVFYTSTGATGAAGVIGWQFSLGRVIQFSTLIGWQEIADADFSRLVTNAVSWAGSSNTRAIIRQVQFEPPVVQVGGSVSAQFTGTNLVDDGYLDVRFRTPGSLTDQVALNWQQGISRAHTIAADISPGIWTVTGVRAHRNLDDHSGEWDSVSAALTVVLTTCFISTPAGDIQGQDLGTSCAFLGIPYAATPTGILRWKPPQPGAPWSPSILFATAAPPNCASINAGTGLPSGAEDCLKLNIWVPKPIPISPAAVMIWIHTGGFVSASANFPGHNGQKLAEQKGVIVVAPNYRLGPFGFLGHAELTNEDPGYHSSGNYGLLDQRAAMVWVKNNIAGFGGNPANITIGGQSAGAHSVSLHVVSPRSGGLFHRAVMESGYASTRWETLEEAELQGNQFALALGCTNASQVLSCMRSKSRDEVLRALPAGRDEFVETPIRWSPIVDGLEIPDQPRFLYERGAFNRVPMLLGANRDEGWVFVDRSFPVAISAAQYEAAIDVEFGPNAAGILDRYRPQDFATPKDGLAQLTGDVEYICEAIRVAELVARTQTPVYLYSFEYVITGFVSDRVIHGLETNFVFGNDFVAPNPGNHALNAADLVLSRSMSGYWTRFLSIADPNATADNSVATWPNFQPPTPFGSAKYLILDSLIRESRSLRASQCDFLKPFFFRSLIGAVPASRL